jgi:hypothetical protein
VEQLENLAALPPAEAGRCVLELRENGIAQEIAAIIHTDNTAIGEISPQKILVRKNRSNETHRISATSALWEPLVYPLLFPCGSAGWGVKDGTLIQIT